MIFDLATSQMIPLIFTIIIFMILGAMVAIMSKDKARWIYSVIISAFVLLAFIFIFVYDIANNEMKSIYSYLAFLLYSMGLMLTSIRYKIDNL